MQLLVVVLLAPILSLAPGTTSNAGASAGYETEVPAGFGVAVNQSDRFQFGNRVSSSVAVGSLASLQSASCAQGTRNEAGEIIREGYVSSPYIQGQPSHARTEPGVRWKVAYCTVETPIYTTSCDSAGNCSTVQTGVEIDHYYLESWEIAHPELQSWLETAIEDAWSQDTDREKVYWNASPGYNSRQIIGLPSWFAASQNPVATTGTEGSFNLGPFRGYGGPSDSATGQLEIWVDLEFELPRSQWSFSDGLNIDCPTAGKLWTESNAQAAISAGGSDPDLCLRGWEDTAVEDSGSPDTVEMERVQLIYPYNLSTNANKAISLAGIDFPTSGEAGTKELGDSRDLIVGEVQTYGVDDNLSLLTADAGGAVSPWVGSSESTCDRIGGWFIIGWAAGPLCRFVASVFTNGIVVLQLVWDGAQFVGTVVSVILSAVWDLVTGCLSLVGDFVEGVAETTTAIVDFMANPSERTQEILKSLDMIREQLSNPDTALEFASTVLVELVGETLSLDMIAERDPDAPGGWVLKENPEWTKWIGRMVCEALVLVLTAGGTAALKLVNSSKVLIRIQRFLRGINIPDINPCVLAILSRGADIAGALADAYEIANAAAQQVDANNQEGNSFPAGTLVLMGDWSHLAIELIEPGDMVMSFDDTNQQWEPQPVTDQWSAIDDGQIATLTLADGSQVQATDGHPFYLESARAWAELEDLRADDLVLTPNGATAVLAVHEADATLTEVFELSVADNHNFAVYTGSENVLVHNRCRNRPNGGGDADGDTNFRQDDDGNVTYDSDRTDVDIDNVLLDKDGNPVVIKSDDFDVVVHTDGSVTVIDKDGNIRPGGVLNPDGSVSVQNADGSLTVIDEDGDTTTLPASSAPFDCNSFPTGTLVRMANGDHRPIEDIEPGDQVLSFDFSNDVWVGATVSAQWSAIDDGAMATVSLTDGSSITATDHHRFWNESNTSWTELDNLDPGNLLLSPQGSPVVADVVVTSEARSLVWELSVDDHSNFTVQAGVSDLLVHNCDIDIVQNADGSTTIVSVGEDGTRTTRTRDGDTYTIEERVPNGNTDIKLVTRQIGDPPNQTVIIERGEGPSIVSTTPPGGPTTITNDNGLTTVIYPDGTRSTTNVSMPDAIPGDPSSLPARPGDAGPTSAVGVIPGPPPQRVELQSGAIGPAYDGDLSLRTDTNFSSTTHVEGHAAAIMRQQGIDRMEITINNNQGICGTCAGQVPNLLPDDGVLIVNSPRPDGTIRTQYIDKDGIHEGHPDD